MAEKNVVLVAVNDNYVPYLAVMVESIIENTDSEKMIDFVVMYSSLNAENKNALEKQIKNKDNIHIEFVDVNDFFCNRDLFVGGRNNKSYLSKETYFRLVAPKVLPQYDKVLYLDSDIIVRKNWDKIFDIDIKNYLVAAVNDIWGNWECYLSHSELVKYRINEILLDNPCSYFNAGVLLINLKEIRNQYKENELLDLAMSKQWRKHDQDLLNFICKDKVKWLDFNWNLIECPSKKAQNVIPKEEYEKYMNCYENPYIIHYATRKPWNVFGMMYEDDFWKYAFSTSYKGQLIKEYIQKQMVSGTILENYVFEGICERKIGVVFILKCILAWIKAVLR